MYTIMRDLPEKVSSPYPPPNPVPSIYRSPDREALLDEYKKECRMIREGVETDIQKCLEEGKTIIIEGANLDPALFIELLRDKNIPTSIPLPPLLSPSFTSPPLEHAHHHHSTSTTIPTSPTTSSSITESLAKASLNVTAKAATTTSTDEQPTSPSSSGSSEKEEKKEKKKKEGKRSFSSSIPPPTN